MLLTNYAMVSCFAEGEVNIVEYLQSQSECTPIKTQSLLPV